MRNFGGRIVLFALIGLGTVPFMLAGGQDMTVPKVLDVHFGPPAAALMAIAAAVLYGCIRLVSYYVLQIVRGAKTAHATVVSYYSHTDSDGDVLTVYRFLTTDGEDLVFHSVPWSAMRNKALNEALQHQGSRIIVSWYPQSKTCKSVTLEQPWTTYEGRASDDTDGRAGDRSGTMPNAAYADATKNTDRKNDEPLKSSALDLQLKPSFLIVWGFTLAAIVVVAIAMYLTSRQLTGVGEQLILRKMTGGIAVLAAAAIMLVHGIVSQFMIRRYDATHHDVDEDAAHVSLMRHVAVVITLVTAGIACIYNPMAALIEGPRTEIVTTGSVTGSGIGTSREYWMLMAHYVGNGGGDDGSKYLVVAIPRTHAEKVRDRIERIYGSQEDTPMKITYWPGGGMQVFDHVEPVDGGNGNGNGTNDPTVE
ncbi:hypothetical protein GFD17_07665 [Bifidobacterium sp. SMB2]|uniref:DUF5671 domain-containing protein n=1 Tax=Bifidobacterium saimiriisciurei TaxID=2661627 RepID=A0ABX0CBR2_9BIFI|nr:MULTISPECIES: hypothetical protein [Bifidobacterium]NEG96628.1 hypothetical protein [Bifidobacterium sp. SMB2]NEH12533.1 hypothetical protein [Bifidobacterium saimiriisciurei]